MSLLSTRAKEKVFSISQTTPPLSHYPGSSVSQCKNSQHKRLTLPLCGGINTRLITLNKAIAATSVGVVNGNMLRDLCYEEDSWAEVDFNVVMTDKNEFVEIQGTAEGETFSKETANSSLSLAQEGIDKLFRIQRQTFRPLS